MTDQALLQLCVQVRELLPRISEGPWETDSKETEDGDGKYYTQEITAADGKVVCEFSNADAEIHIEYDEDGATRWDSIAKNNAALIALAPTMAAALLKLRESEAAMEKDRDAWRQAMQRLTPGGSEFTRPVDCEQWAAMLRTELHEAKCDRVRSQRATEQAEAKLAKIAEIANERPLSSWQVVLEMLDRIAAIATSRKEK